MRSLNPEGIEKLTSVIEKLYKSKRYVSLRNILSSYYPADIEEAMSNMSVQDISYILQTLNPTVLLSIFEYLPTETQVRIIEYLKDYEIRYIFENLPSDDKTFLLRKLDEELKQKVLALLTDQQRATTEQYLAYRADTAASIASDYYTTTYEFYTVTQATENLREAQLKTENLYTIYVLNEEEQLVGSIALEQLVFEKQEKCIKDIMKTNVLYIHDVDSDSTAIEYMNKYDIAILPVINAEKRLMGIITYDDIMDLVVQKGIEDMHKFAGLTGKDRRHDNYLKQSIWKHAQRRFTWILIPVLMEMLTGLIIHSNHQLLQKFFILTLYIPMITAAGGGIGSQSASMIIQAIALKEVSFKDIFTVLFKELRVSCIVGVIISSFLLISISYNSHLRVLDTQLLMSIVCISMFLQLISSSILGALIPLIAHSIKLDPALLSAPVVSSIVDISGMLIYFSIASIWVL